MNQVKTIPLEDHDNAFVFLQRISYEPALPFDEQLQRAQPRLLRLIRRHGIPPDAAQDILQDSLFAAWRGRGSLRSPDQFDAWIDAICRNHCRLYFRAQRSPAGMLHALPVIPDPMATAGEDRADRGDIPDLSAEDPFDAVSRRDLETLIDHALGYLTPDMRAALEVRYLDDLPEREAAAVLSVSVNVLQSRLHRARERLRAIFSGPLRAEAESFGMAVDSIAPEGWQPTRIWCAICGRHRLVGKFDHVPEEVKEFVDEREMRLRCPACSVTDMDVFRSKGMVDLGEVRAFRPALTRTMRTLEARTRQRMNTGRDRCAQCGAAILCRIVWPDELPSALPQQLRQHWVIGECRTLGCPGDYIAWTIMEPVTWFHPSAQRFRDDHPRWIIGPEEMVEWQGISAIRFRMLDVASAAQLSLLADPRTLDIMTTF
jgi:RNA polymerase sigma factor (sigma-70 family)